MNILPHKSWHVRTKANIERVRKDEEKAAEEEKEKQRRIALAEQEARTNLLRKQAEGRRALEHGETSTKSIDLGNESIGARSESIDTRSESIDTRSEGIDARSESIYARSEDKNLSITDGSSGHINLFTNIEESERQGGNKDFEAEKKAEKEKQEKAIGLLTYLGQSAVEAQAAKPWYFKPPEKSSKKDPKEHKSISSEEFDVKTKSKLDPMNDMVRYLEKKRKAEGSKDDLDDYHRKKKHRHKDKHRERERSKSSGSSSSSSSSGSKSIEQLRADRLRREKEERSKQEKLLAKVRGVKLPDETAEEVDDRSRRYNQQYNPDLVRKPKKPRDYTDYRD